MNRERKNTSTETTDDFEFAENVVRSGQEIYSLNQRHIEKDCFSSAQLQELISKDLPNDKILEHLFSCSSCLNEYRNALNFSKQTIATPKLKPWWKNLFNISQASFAWGMAGLIVLFSIVLGLIWLFYPVNSHDSDLAKNQEINPKKGNSSEIQNPIIITEVNEDNKNNTFPTKNKQIEIPTADNSQNIPKRPFDKPKIIEKNPVKISDEIDLTLNENQVLRNQGNSEKNNPNLILLPAKKVSLNIKLSKLFNKGFYKFKIVDAFNNILFEKKVNLKNQSIVVKEINLEKLQSSASKLCLQNKNEIPDCFDLEIKK